MRAFVVSITCLLIASSLRSAGEYESFTSHSAPFQAAGEITSLIERADSKQDRSQWARLVKQVTAGSIEPIIVIITDTNFDSLVGARSLTPYAKVVLVLIGNKAADDIAVSKDELVTLTVATPELEDWAAERKRQPAEYVGAYVFGQRGKLIWWATKLNDTTIADAAVVAETLATAAGVRKSLLRRAPKSTRTPGKVRRVGSREFGPEQPVAELIADAGERAVLLSVWATYCPPCIAELPLLQSLANTYSTKMRYVGLLTDPPADDLITKIDRLSPAGLRRSQFVLRDHDVVVKAFPDQKQRHIADLTVPSFILISPRGNVLYKSVGSLLGNAAQLEKLRHTLDNYKDGSH